MLRRLVEFLFPLRGPQRLPREHYGDCSVTLLPVLTGGNLPTWVVLTAVSLRCTSFLVLGPPDPSLGEDGMSALFLKRERR
jgi:hypothetical protein